MNDHDRDRGPSASGRIPEDAPGGPELEPRPADWDDAAMDRFWLGVYSRLERGLAWTLVSASAAVLLGYWAYVFATEFMADATVPVIVRFRHRRAAARHPASLAGRDPGADPRPLH